LVCGSAPPSAASVAGIPRLNTHAIPEHAARERKKRTIIAVYMPCIGSVCNCEQEGLREQDGSQARKRPACSETRFAGNALFMGSPASLPGFSVCFDERLHSLKAE